MWKEVLSGNAVDVLVPHVIHDAELKGHTEKHETDELTVGACASGGEFLHRPVAAERRTFVGLLTVHVFSAALGQAVDVLGHHQTGTTPWLAHHI